MRFAVLGFLLVLAGCSADATLLDVQSRCATGDIDSETFIIIVQADRDAGISKQDELTTAINGCALEDRQFDCIDCLTAVVDFVYDQE